MRSERTVPTLCTCGLTSAHLREQSYRQMEEDRIRKVVLPSVYPNKGECEIVTVR